MTIVKDKVVLIDYTLTDVKGEIIDTSDGREPLAYLHGNGHLIPGLEKELEGKVIGDKLDVSIDPKEGYGPRNEELVREVPLANFPEGQVQPGMQFQAKSEQGAMVFTVIEVRKETVLIDGNHPLAGVTLNFKVEIKEIREATKEEIEHGHVHGPGGHQH